MGKFIAAQQLLLLFYLFGMLGKDAAKSDAFERALKCWISGSGKLEAPILIWRLNCVYVGIWWDEKYAFSQLKWTFLSYFFQFAFIFFLSAKYTALQNRWNILTENRKKKENYFA